MGKVPRRYKPLAGSERSVGARAKRIGAADPDEQITVSVYVRRRADLLPLPTSEELAASPAHNRPRLTGEQLRERFGARAKDIDAVKAFAEASSLTVELADPGRRLVRLSGTSAQFARAFRVELLRYGYAGGGAYRGHEGPLRVPRALTRAVEGVFGLDNRPRPARGGNGTVTGAAQARASSKPAPAISAASRPSWAGLRARA